MFPSIPLLKNAVSSPASQPFLRSQYGLFDGKMKRYGNNVPFSKHKTRRTWLPNIQSKRILSETLGGLLKLKVTTRALRSIRKAGGLDQYLLKTRHEKLGFEGIRLRILIRQAQEEAKAQAEGTQSTATEQIILPSSSSKPTMKLAQRIREDALAEMSRQGLLFGDEDQAATEQKLLSFLNHQRELLHEQPTTPQPVL